MILNPGPFYFLVLGLPPDELPPDPAWAAFFAVFSCSALASLNQNGKPIIKKKNPDRNKREKEWRERIEDKRKTFHGAARESNHRLCFFPCHRCEPEPFLGLSPSGFRVEIWVKGNKLERRRNLQNQWIKNTLKEKKRKHKLMENRKKEKKDENWRLRRIWVIWGRLLKWVVKKVVELEDWGRDLGEETKNSNL